MSAKKRKRHGPEEIVRKLRDAEAMLNAGKDLAAVLQSLEVSEATYHRWRNQYGGMNVTVRRRTGGRGLGPSGYWSGRVGRSVAS